jgi:hypothetical protein
MVSMKTKGARPEGVPFSSLVTHVHITCTLGIFTVLLAGVRLEQETSVSQPAALRSSRCCSASAHSALHVRAGATV